MNILVDAMGGDNAPLEIVKGAAEAVIDLGVDVTLVGRGEDILAALREQGMTDLPKGLSVSHAEQVVLMTDSPASSGKEKPDSSLAVGLRMLSGGEGDAFVSAGNTGALLSGAILTAKRIRGIRRAALAPVIPTKEGGAILIDCGANLECKPEYLLQFGHMGSLYAQKVLGRQKPRVGLLNIGTEESKGPELQREAYRLLKEAGDAGKMNFVGNIEGRDVAFGVADVVVCRRLFGQRLPQDDGGCGAVFRRHVKRAYFIRTR